MAERIIEVLDELEREAAVSLNNPTAAPNFVPLPERILELVAVARMVLIQRDAHHLVTVDGFNGDNFERSIQARDAAFTALEKIGGDRG